MDDDWPSESDFERFEAPSNHSSSNSHSNVHAPPPIKRRPGEPAVFAKLNDEQYAAATNPADAFIALVAGAGSGKTSVIASRITHLVKAANIESKQILCITFTRTGAIEMKSRIGKDDYIGRWHASRMTICTFHKLSMGLLHKFAGSSSSPALAGLSPKFGIENKGNDVMARVVARYLDRRPLAATAAAVPQQQASAMHTGGGGGARYRW